MAEKCLWGGGDVELLTQPLTAPLKRRRASSARLGVPPLGELEDEARSGP
ncbi:hypothetical protein GCM10009540_74720 [Streptomyces turgidiscabies]